MRLLLPLLLFAVPSSLLQAQLRVDFNTDKPGGCSPLSISLTNTTAGASASTSYQWDFGNGNSSVLKDAAASYYEEKTYTITLTVRDGAQVSTQTKTVTVYHKPSLAFDISPARGCLPSTVSFTSSSLPGDGQLTSYYWDFGDGTTQQSSAPAILHTYDFLQTASVSLTAVNNYGCSNTISKTNSVTVLRAVTVDFVTDQVIFCNAPATARFTNRSGGPGTLSYKWDFGDGKTSTETSPAHTYTARGIYTVQLTVQSSEGCTNSVTRTSYINVADFTTDFQVPSLACSNGYLTFNNTSSPTPDRSTWVVDGTNSYAYYGGASFTDAFTTPGMHTMELINTFGSCEQRLSKQVAVKPVPVLDGFLVDIAGLCGAPVQVNFRDTCSTAVSWDWAFNLYSPGSITHATTRATSATYAYDNLYSVQLTVTNADGCSSTAMKQIGISRPQVGIFLEPGSTDEGCVPVVTKFSVRTTDPLTNYQWNFGDGGSSTDAIPTHTYTAAGIYNVSLTYTTANGCTGTVAYYNTIKVRQKPVANFSVTSTVCGNTPVWFTNTSSGYITNYIWNFGESPFNEASGMHQYQTPGDFNVMLIAYNGLCNDTVIKPAIIKVSPPFAKIAGTANTCEGTRGLVTFTDGSRQADSWRWDFGDGSTMSYTTAQPVVEHTYSRSGQFKVVLTVTNGPCVVKDSTSVYIFLKQNPVLTANASSICTEGGSLSIKVDGLQKFLLPNNNYVPPYYGYTIQKEDGAPISGYYHYNPADPLGYSLPWTSNLAGFVSGQETFRVISKSVYFNCYDTTNLISITIGGPAAAFQVSSSTVCYKSMAMMQDQSTGKNNIPIVKWDWSFGDGQTATQAQSGTVTHRYNEPGVYYVTLRVTDANGCSSSFTNYASPVYVTGPKVFFSTSGTNVPLNTSVSFYNYTNDYNTAGVTYHWDFGNSVTSTEFSPSYTYTMPGDYTITLIAENAQTQCRDTARQTITVRNFNTGFTKTASFIGSQSTCLPVLARFSNTSTNYTRLVWDFGDGFSLENHPYPTHIYTEAGKYVVILYVYGYNGLSAIYKDTVIVSDPAATLRGDGLEGCIGQRVSLSAPIHPGIVSYSWDFGNGHVNIGEDSFAVHRYLAAGTYSPSLIVRDAGGCQASVTLPDKVIIHPDPVVTISPAAPVVCKSAPVQLQSSGGVGYAWTPANGLSAANIANPYASPASTTAYSVTVTDGHGCKGDGVVMVTVPTAFVMDISPSAEVCKGSTVQLKATGAVAYQWINTTTGLSNTSIPDPVASPVANTTYTVVGYDAYRCYTDTKNIDIAVRPLPAVNAGADQEVIYGSANELKAVYSNDVTRWAWTPSDYLSCTSCPAPIARPYATIDYILTVFNAYDCQAKDTVRLKGICTDGNIYIPNAFTPNNDGKNDVFTINGYGVSKIRSFRIYNRWGEIVFEKKDFLPNDNSSAWNGRYKGIEAPTAAYVYFVEMECAMGERFERKGTVTLVR